MGASKYCLPPLLVASLLGATSEKAAAHTEAGVRAIERLSAIRSELHSMTGEQQPNAARAQLQPHLAQWRNY
jgi:hypothetical protein